MSVSQAQSETQPLAPASRPPSQIDVEASSTPFSRLEAAGGRLYAHRFTPEELDEILHGNCPPPPGAPAGGRWQAQRMCYGAAEVVYIERGMCGEFMRCMHTERCTDVIRSPAGMKWNPDGTQRCWIEQTPYAGCLVASIMVALIVVAITAGHH